MKTKVLSFLILGLCLSKLLVAAVEPGQNILLNADFEAEQMDFPPLWSQSDETVVFFRGQLRAGVHRRSYLSQSGGHSQFSLCSSAGPRVGCRRDLYD